MTVLINEEEVVGKYNLELIDILKRHESLIFDDKIIFNTNVIFKHPAKIIQIFNIYLKTMKREGLVRIIINLNK